MKFKNIFFGFLKTLLLTVVFHIGLLCANEYMIFDLQNYQPTDNSPPPYFFQRDPATGDLVRLTDTEGGFQFKTYNLQLKADLAQYKIEVRPTLLRWKEKIIPLEKDSSSSSFFSGDLANKVDAQSSKRPPPREVHVATYKDRIEAVSYVNNRKPESPEIDILTANPEGMRVGQTTNVKGAGSALLDYELKTFKGRGAESAQLLSIRDKYYLDRGWKIDFDHWIEVEDSDDQSSCEGE
ncbi:hypothetical protein [Bathymodiolus thermophilus thioautotrophic gill symbiont]|uniref:Uncharacterized protein n=1 Tax=Bathymodiolus thermophilus thioautotrophic gill symbiont TaxID=2360 RepID=A0A1J5UFE8_9GAMM|nr:hypothetical protein [Bathymodiolus thermophilus thioautotrophic gill symbiont]OIR24637.1 hypothetical protein BGC33_11195 [Bathymodiolus thermophilus thioautotrophic gill symbiont]